MEKYDTYKDSGIEWIGAIPAHWEVKKLSYCFEKIGSGTTPKSTNQDYYFNGDFNWLQTGDLTDNLIFRTSKKITQKALNDYSTLNFYPLESIVIAMYGATIGKMGLLKIETTTNQACCVLAKPNNVFSEFVFYWFRSIKKHIISLSYGGGQPNINQEQIRNLRIQLPLLEEQTKIANYLDKKTAEIDDLIAQKKKLLKLYKKEKEVIINQAVTKGINPNVKLKNSGIEWLGDIPEHWASSKLKYNTEKISDGIHSTPKYTDNSDFKFINGNNLKNGLIEFFDVTKSVTEEEYDNLKKTIQKGAVLISINGTIGNLAFYNDEKVILGKSASYIECSDSLYNEFLFYLLQTHYIKTQFNLSYSGSTINNLSLYTSI
jgi:type I restriction enzyme S subunit